LNDSLLGYYSKGFQLAEPRNVGSGSEIKLFCSRNAQSLNFSAPGTAFWCIPAYFNPWSQ